MIDSYSTYGELLASPPPWTFGLDMNYTTADGSARSIQRIRYYDDRVNLNRSPGAYGWAWIIPTPD